MNTDALFGCQRPGEEFDDAVSHRPGKIRSVRREADAPCLAAGGAVQTRGMSGFQLRDQIITIKETCHVQTQMRICGTTHFLLI